MAAEQVDDGLAFVQAQQAVIDEHAGELVADRFVNENSGDRAVDAAGQPADHPALADLLPDFLDRLVLEGPHCPVATALRDLATKCARAERPAACASLRDGTACVELPLLVGDHGDRRVGGGCRRCGSPSAAGVTRSP